MASFKVSKKNALSDTRTNIYDLHEKKLEYFDIEKSKEGEYTDELNELKEKRKHAKCHGKRFEIDKRIEILEIKLNNIKDDTELNEYLLEFSSTINDYSDCSFEESSQKGIMDSFINVSVNNQKTELYNEYIKRFNPELKEIHLTKNEKWVCEKCGSDLYYDQVESTETCKSCGLSTNTILHENNGTFVENIEQVVVFNYKRNGHFQECLNQIQAKENTRIPPIIFQKLTEEFKKYNISNPKLFTSKLVKMYLCKLGFSKYYEHIPTIINEFCGLPPLKFTPSLEKDLRIMFDEMQAPFERHRLIICPKRKNFLNYNYTFYKMFQLLGKDEFLGYFPLLKSREKLYEHELLWKGICKDLRWQFIASI